MIVRLTKTTPSASIPVFATASAAGADLFSNEPSRIEPSQRKLIKTGIKMEIPEGYVGLIWDRSGMAYKAGAKVLGGVIDSDYRGEIGVILFNTSDTPIIIQQGDRIAQMVFQRVSQFVFEEVESLQETARGAGGYGSTGR